MADYKGAVLVKGVDFDIRNLVPAQDKVSIGNGTYDLAINSDGSINAVLVDGGVRKCDYFKGAAVAANAVSNHDYVVTSGKTAEGFNILVGARGEVRVEVQTCPDPAAETPVFTTLFVWFQQPSVNTFQNIPCLKLLGDGTAIIRIAITNLDDATSDVYSTLQCIEK